MIMQTKFWLAKIILFGYGFVSICPSTFSLVPNLLIIFQNQELKADVIQTAWGIWKVAYHSSNMQKILKWSTYSASFNSFVNSYTIYVDIDSKIEGFEDEHSQSFVGLLSKTQIKDYFQDDKKTPTNILINDFYKREFITGGTQAKTNLCTLADENFLYMYSEVWAGGGGASFYKQKMRAQLEIKSVKFIFQNNK